MMLVSTDESRLDLVFVASDVNFFFEVDLDTSCHLISTFVLGESPVLLLGSYCFRTLDRCLLILDGTSCSLYLLSASNLSKVSLPLLNLTVLLDLDQLGTLVAKLACYTSLLLFVADECGATVIRYHLQSNRNYVIPVLKFDQVTTYL